MKAHDCTGSMKASAYEMKGPPSPMEGFRVVQLVKNPPAMRETWVRSLGWEDPWVEGMATHSIIPAWRLPRRSPADCSACGHKDSDHKCSKSLTRVSD